MVTHPPKGDRDTLRSHVVFTTCDSGIFDTFQGTSTPSLGDQLWQVLHCLSVLPGIHSLKLQVNLPQKQYTIQQCQPSKH